MYCEAYEKTEIFFWIVHSDIIHTSEMTHQIMIFPPHTQAEQASQKGEDVATIEALIAEAHQARHGLEMMNKKVVEDVCEVCGVRKEAGVRDFLLR
jgi:hypothetical protein